MIIDNQVKDLVFGAEEVAKTKPETLDQALSELISALRARCLLTENQERYAVYNSIPGGMGRYPTDAEGYAIGIDPLNNESDFFEAWRRFGVVVGKGVIPPELCQLTTQRIREMVLDLSHQNCDLLNPSDYEKIPVDLEGNPLISRGFLEVYHDDSLAQLRQALRVYLHHVVIWGRVDLWTTFDRYGVKLPQHSESKALPLHVDQNPHTHPDFKGIQGILALVDCPKERGTFVAVPGSKRHFLEYQRMAGPHSGDYVPLAHFDRITDLLSLNAQPLPLRAGDLVSWDSRTTHCNTANTSDDIRMVGVIAAGPASPNNARALTARKEAFKSGLGSNDVKRGMSANQRHHTLMHASTKPRFVDQAATERIRHPEALTLLGKLLYSQKTYGEI